ncbi:MAG TPA: transporter substrate-binding domain-containing protein [Feifaniaceae bacterium]|nr:transporter substrate-binding domain-containing protein [Feifaniaceae bacterium]
MKKAYKAIALTLAILLGAFAFAACAPAASETPNIDKIKKAGKLVILTSSGFAPFEYLGASNEVVGVDMDIAKAVADELGVALEVVDMDFDGIVPAVQSGKGDLGAAGITANDERRQSVDFSINYVDAAQVIIVPEGSDIKSAADLAGKNVGVQMGTTGDTYVTDEVGAGQVLRYKTGPDAGVELANGKIDAVVIDELPAKQIAEANKGLVVLEEPLTEEQYAIALKKDSPDLKSVVDKVVQKLLDDGTVAKLIEEHKAASGS